jgi:hypothetical protein
MHLNSNAAFGGRCFNTDRGALFFVAVAKVVAKPTTRAVTNAALTSFGVR